MSPYPRDSCVRGRGLASRPAPASAGRPPPSCPGLVNTSSYRGRRLTEISRLLFMCRLSGYQDTLTSSHHNHNPPSSLTTAHCWSLIPPPLPRIIPVRLLADEERILRLEHESCKELPWDQRLLPSSRLPSFIHPLLAAIPSPATTTYQ